MREYADEWLLAFDRNDELLFLDVYVQISSFEVPWDLNNDIEIADCLGPLVGKRILLFLLFGGGCSLLLFGEFCIAVSNLKAKLCC